MFRTLTAAVVGLGLVLASGARDEAAARDKTAQIIVGTLAGVAAVGILANALRPYPVYAAPRPVYVAPRPVYVAPRPVYVAPRPVYVAPRYVYPRPVYVAPRYVYPRPVYRDRVYYRPYRDRTYR